MKKSKSFLIFAAFVLLFPTLAFSDIIHEATYKWFDIGGDYDIDYVLVVQSAPTAINYTIPMPGGAGETGGTVLIEVLEKFFNVPQGNYNQYLDFEWTVLKDSPAPGTNDIRSFHVSNGGIPALLQSNTLGWDFTQDSQSYNWVIGTSGHEIDGNTGGFRVAVPADTGLEISNASVDYQANQEETFYLYGRTSHPYVPEPISLILLGSGLAGAGLYRRLRKPKG